MRIITLFCVFCICIMQMHMDALPSTITYESLMKQLEQDNKRERQEAKPTKQTITQEKNATQKDCGSVFSRIWYAFQGYTQVNSGEQD